jgi:hypothetical protein
MAVSTIDALYHSGSEKLTTSATGITVTGTVAATAYTGDGSALTGTGSPSIDDNGDATAITIDSSENVGIGTSSPNADLVVTQSGATFTPSSQTVALFQRNSASGSGAKVCILAGNLSSSDLNFGDVNNEEQGRLRYEHNNDAMTFTTNGSERMRIDASGRVTKPNQPAFYVNKGTAQEPIGPTINTAYTISYTSEKYDEGNNFANSIFTAPVTGKYLLMAQVQMVYAETQGNAYILTLETSNRTFGQNVSQKFSSTPTFSTLFAKNVVDMDAGDTATVKLRYYSVVGSNPDVPSGYDGVTFFSGYLLG